MSKSAPSSQQDTDLMSGTQGDRLDIMSYIKSGISLRGYLAFVKLNLIIDHFIQRYLL